MVEKTRSNDSHRVAMRLMRISNPADDYEIETGDRQKPAAITKRTVGDTNRASYEGIKNIIKEQILDFIGNASVQPVRRSDITLAFSLRYDACFLDFALQELKDAKIISNVAIRYRNSEEQYKIIRSREQLNPRRVSAILGQRQAENLGNPKTLNLGHTKSELLEEYKTDSLEKVRRLLKTDGLSLKVIGIDREIGELKYKVVKRNRRIKLS